MKGKTFWIGFTLVIWMILTLILTCSIIGMLLFIPQPNYTGYHKPQGELRSTWMRIGYSLKDTLINL